MMSQNKKSDIDELLEEFRKIGRDSEYYPETEEVTSVDMVAKRECVYDREHHGKALSYIVIWGEVSAIPFQPPKDEPLFCGFCRKNGETFAFYGSHCLKDKNEKVCCPVLRKYICPICQATGDNAHTVKYCPYNRGSRNIPLITQLKCLRNSMGKFRGRSW